MPETEQSEGIPGWRKSTFSISNGACVEAATVINAVVVRDTVSPAEGQLRFPAGAWRDFIVRVKQA